MPLGPYLLGKVDDLERNVAMKIAANPPGLLARRFFPIDRGRWVMEEEWNIDTPGCPMIRSPWHHGPFNDGPIFIRQIEMTTAEYVAVRDTLGQNVQEEK